MRAAGFADFDKMAVAYYTAPFERGSMPALAQRASRGRRLKNVLGELRASSDAWPRMESRGLREGAVEATSEFFLFFSFFLWRLGELGRRGDSLCPFFHFTPFPVPPLFFTPRPHPPRLLISVQIIS